MIDGTYILVNGTFEASAGFRLPTESIDDYMFTEQIRAIRSDFPFFHATLDYINLNLRLFNQTFPEFTENEGAGLRRQLERTLTKNKFFMGAVLTIRFWLADQKVHYAISCLKHEKINFELNSSGLYISIFSEINKSTGLLSGLPVGSELVWKIAEMYRDKNTTDQLLILNDKEMIVEAIGANIYLIKGNEITGVSIRAGAYLDMTKSILLKIFRELGYEYNETTPITENDVLDAQEIMLANSIEGLRWVVGYGGKRYFNTTIRRINEAFVKKLIN